MKNEDMDLNLASEIVKKQNKSLRKAIPQGYFFTFLYGTAWVIGYTALGYTNLSKLGYKIFSAALITAVVISVIYLVKTLKGIKTSNAKYNIWTSVSWGIGFIVHSGIMAGISKTLKDVDPIIISKINWQIGNSIPLLIVALCFFGVASSYKDTQTGIMGIIVAILSIVSANVKPVTGAYLCAAGGGIMLMIALLDFIKSRRIGGERI